MTDIRPYAAGTSVAAEKTKAEIDTLLSKHGASQRAVMADDSNGRAVIAFVINDRHYRLDVPMPKPGELPDPKKRSWEQKVDMPRGWDSWLTERRLQWVKHELDQRARERWRAVLMMLKAKLELVRIGVSTVEREFLADMVVGKRTVGQMVEEQIDQVLAGHTPRLLPETT